MRARRPLDGTGAPGVGRQNQAPTLGLPGFDWFVASRWGSIDLAKLLLARFERLGASQSPLLARVGVDYGRPWP